MMKPPHASETYLASSFFLSNYRYICLFLGKKAETQPHTTQKGRFWHLSTQ